MFIVWLILATIVGVLCYSGFCHTKDKVRDVKEAMGYIKRDRHGDFGVQDDYSVGGMSQREFQNSVRKLKRKARELEEWEQELNERERALNREINRIASNRYVDDEPVERVQPKVKRRNYEEPVERVEPKVKRRNYEEVNEEPVDIDDIVKIKETKSTVRNRYEDLGIERTESPVNKSKSRYTSSSFGS